jgi:hypothetical protein
MEADLFSVNVSGRKLSGDVIQEWSVADRLFRKRYLEAIQNTVT